VRHNSWLQKRAHNAFRAYQVSVAFKNAFAPDALTVESIGIYKPNTYYQPKCIQPKLYKSNETFISQTYKPNGTFISLDDNLFTRHKFPLWHKFPLLGLIDHITMARLAGRHVLRACTTCEGPSSSSLGNSSTRTSNHQKIWVEYNKLRHGKT
jgi:hypothetical protein